LIIQDRAGTGRFVCRADGRRAGLHGAGLEERLLGHRRPRLLHAGDGRGGCFCLVPELLEPAGLAARRGESFAPLEDIFRDYAKDYPDLACEPGKYSNYANSHYLALARVIEEVSGEPYETFVVDHILAPLLMDSTHFQLVEPGERYAKGQYLASRTDSLVALLNEYRGPGQEALILHKGESFSTMDDFRILPPWGGLLGTPSDLTHFLQMHMNGGRYGEAQILKPETVAAIAWMRER
jgi:CubicO group peptidase (beta-lactamase class C family)